VKLCNINRSGSFFDTRCVYRLVGSVTASGNFVISLREGIEFVF